MGRGEFKETVAKVVAVSRIFDYRIKSYGGIRITTDGLSLVEALHNVIPSLENSIP